MEPNGEANGGGSGGPAGSEGKKSNKPWWNGEDVYQISIEMSLI